MTLNSAERREYVREVCRALWGKEPEDLKMPVAEFGVLQGWMDKEVPLRVVLQVIEQFKGPRGPNFIRAKVNGRAVRYIKPAVEEELARRNKALA